MLLTEILERNGIDTTGCESSSLATPLAPFFLEEKYIRKCGALAELPEEMIQACVDYASELKSDRLLRALAWHLYRLFCMIPDFKTFPDHIDVTGKKTGILYLIILLSLHPHLKLRMELDGLPAELADRAMSRCTSLLPNRDINYPGEKGLQGRALPFMLNYKNTPSFRIGRFDFVLTRVPSTYPELFRSRKDRSYVGLCRSNWRVDSAGNLHAYDDESLPPVGLKEENNCITGRKIDLVSGTVTPETVTLDLAEYERLLSEDANVLLIHISGGGGMTMDVCKESFIQAREFCRKYFPEVSFAAFGCTSWVFYPEWRKYLPDSNLSKLQMGTLAFPVYSAPRNGLYFVFGHDDGDPASYPADNSLRRAMIQAWNDKGALGAGGMLLPLDETDNFPLNQGKIFSNNN